MIGGLSPGQLRRVQRRAHLFAGAWVLAYVYLPMGAPLEAIVKFVLVPVLVLSGVAMWQASRIRRALRRYNLRPWVTSNGR